jgi:glyceraldehyde 3-phosphate dehydrogenase
MLKVAINGFGRIGRAAFKALLAKKNVEVVAINDLTDAPTLAHLLKYDSVYGIYGKKVEAVKGNLVVGGKKYQVFAEPDPKALPWKKLGVDVVIEATGIWRDTAGAGAHLAAGAKKVIVTAPCKDEKNTIKTFVLGVNAETIKKTDKVISMASCTTNCLAPVTEIIRQAFGIKKALMTTAHSYTADQNLVDGPHKDLRRARSAALSIIPTTTGAAVAVTKTIPELAGNFDGMALRVPTPVGSLCDTVYLVKKQVSVQDVNKAIIKASKNAKYKGIVEVTNDPIVSADIVGNPASAIVDLALTTVIGKDLVKVVSWYDNEWGYSCRLADLAEYIYKRKLL